MSKMINTWKLEFYTVEGGVLKTEQTQSIHLSRKMTKKASTELVIFPDSVSSILWINFKID